MTKGHSGLTHSSTTVLPLKSERECCLPVMSGSVKSGAALPTSAVAACPMARAARKAAPARRNFVRVFMREIGEQQTHENGVVKTSLGGIRNHRSPPRRRDNCALRRDPPPVG